VLEEREFFTAEKKWLELTFGFLLNNSKNNFFKKIYFLKKLFKKLSKK
jgi:hypothetical protein